MSSTRASARQSAAFATRRAVGRRLWILAALLLIPLVAVAIRLVQWQWLQHDKWRQRAENNKLRTQVYGSTRGAVYFADGTLAAGERPVFGVEVVADDTCPPADLQDAVAGALGVSPEAAALLLRRRDPAARQAAHVARVEAWQRTCRALVAAARGEREPAPTPPPVRPAYDASNPFNDRQATQAAAPVAGSGVDPGRSSVGIEDVLGRAAELEADAVHRMGREWARIMGIALAAEHVDTPRTVARAAADAGDAEHVRWIAEQGAPVLLPEPSSGALGTLADRRRAALHDLLAAQGRASLMEGREMVQQLRDADRIFARYLRRLLADQPMLLLPEVDNDVVLAIEVRREGPLPGVRVVARGHRIYPQHAVGAHVLGTLGLEVVRTQSDGTEVDEYAQREADGVYWWRVAEVLDRADYEALEARGVFRGEPYGRTGLERVWEPWLTGSYGVRISENDARGRLREMLLQIPAVPGRAIHCTLDPRAQRVAETALGAACDAVRRVATRTMVRIGGETRPLESADEPSVRGAAAVVIDVETGAVRVCASWPGFDPNLLVPPVPAAVAARLYTGPSAAASPTLNRAIQGHYPPGSVLKILTMVAALQHGLGSDPCYECEGKWQPTPGGITLGCMHTAGDGLLTLEEALTRSCNIVFFKAGWDLKRERLAATMAAFGLGQQTACGLPFESGGALPADVNAVQLAIGQGSVEVTPMQVARFCAAIANGGRLVVPRLVEESEIPPAPVVEGYTPDVQERVHAGMRGVVFDAHGTAKLELLRQLRAVGKTGTAEKVKHRWNVVSFAGFAPYDAPKYAFAVFVEQVPHKMYAGDVAAPVAARILQALLEPEPAK